jgi:hypothetical protein
MRLVLPLLLLAGGLGLSACSDDEPAGSGVNVDALVKDRTRLQAEVKAAIDRAQELSNAVIPARNAWLAAQKQAGGDDKAPEVVAAKQALDDASAAYQKAYDGRLALEAQLGDVESKLKKAGWKPPAR